MVRRLREACAPGCFTLAHVYCAFNIDADSLANEAIDRRGGTADNVVIDDHWTSSQLDAMLYVDDEGDVIMH